MKKVDFNFQIKDGRNNVVGKQTGAEIIAHYLNEAIIKDEAQIIKFHAWAVHLSRHDILELDDGDILTLKNFILNHEQIFVVAKQPLIMAFSQPPAPGTKPHKKD